MNGIEKLLTPKQVSEALGVQENTLAVWRSTKRYDLRSVRVGRLVRYRAADVRDFIEKNVQTAGAGSGR